MKEQKILSERIQELCRARRMSYYLLAYKSGVPITTVMNIVHCTTKNPGIFTIIRLCGALGVSVGEFFDSEEFRSMEENWKEGQQ
ncbi:MAG TPA: helix-turn-helix transcriptional regulator [Candidatus Blautia faecipullorum]|nr:helix-turn-helix transcriptional regulator [Candidatus Blautia faecipullorum]